MSYDAGRYNWTSRCSSEGADDFLSLRWIGSGCGAFDHRYVWWQWHGKSNSILVLEILQYRLSTESIHIQSSAKPDSGRLALEKLGKMKGRTYVHKKRDLSSAERCTCLVCEHRSIFRFRSPRFLGAKWKYCVTDPDFGVGIHSVAILKNPHPAYGKLPDIFAKYRAHNIWLDNLSLHSFVFTIVGDCHIDLDMVHLDTHSLMNDE